MRSYHLFRLYFNRKPRTPIGFTDNSMKPNPRYG